MLYTRATPTFSRTPPKVRDQLKSASGVSSALDKHMSLLGDRDAAPSPVVRTSPSPVPRSPTPRKSSFSAFSNRASSPLPESHPAFGITPLEVEDSRPNLLSINTKLVGPTAPPSPPTTAGFTNSSGSSSVPSTPKSTIPLHLNTNLPSYILDQIHPCIPFPPCWDPEHDQYIAYLDVQDYLYPSIVYRVKQKFPRLQAECITPGMIEKRLNILDMRPHCAYFARGLELREQHARDREQARRGDGAWLETLTEVDSCGGTDLERTGAQPGGRVASPRKRHDPNDHRRRVSTGGLSGKIVIAKGKATVVTNGAGGGSFGGGSGSSGSLGRPQTSPLTGNGRKTSDSVPPSPAGSVAKGKGKKVVRSKTLEVGHDEPFGVPSVMRTSSGKPVLR